MMSKFFLTLTCAAALGAMAVASAGAQEFLSRKGQVPMVGSDQATRDAKPLVAGKAIAGQPQMTPQLQAPKAQAAVIQGLAAIKHGHDGKDSTIELAPKLQMMLKQGAMAPKPFKGDGGKLVQVKNSRVAPYASMGVIATGCSGALVMKRFVVTVPWCVYDSKKKAFYDNLDFTPAVNGNDAPVGTIKWKNVWIAKGYQDTGNLDYAFALIELDQDIGDKVGWFGFGPTKGSDNVKQMVLSGYPFDNVPNNTIWETKCNIDASETSAYFYHCPGDGKTIASMGGSPLYMKATNAKDADQLLGIHASSQNDKQDSFWAMKLNDTTTQTLLSWANDGKTQTDSGTQDQGDDSNGTDDSGNGTSDNGDNGGGDNGNGTSPQCSCDQGNN